MERVRILAAGVRAWRSYRGAGLATRVFLAARLLVLPLKPLAEEFERATIHQDIAPTPRWKHAVNRLHDRFVSGEATAATDPTSLAELFANAGFSIERLQRVAPLSPYPHFILRARRVPYAL